MLSLRLHGCYHTAPASATNDIVNKTRDLQQLGPIHFAITVFDLEDWRRSARRKIRILSLLAYTISYCSLSSRGMRCLLELSRKHATIVRPILLTA